MPRAQFSRLRAALIAEAAEVVLLRRLRVEVAEARDVDAVRPLPLVEAVAEVVGQRRWRPTLKWWSIRLWPSSPLSLPRPFGNRSDVEFSRMNVEAIADAQQEDDAREVLGRLVRLRVDDAHAGRALRVFGS